VRGLAAAIHHTTFTLPRSDAQALELYVRLALLAGSGPEARVHLDLSGSGYRCPFSHKVNFLGPARAIDQITHFDPVTLATIARRKHTWNAAGLRKK
jgi:hypothetical protein